MSSRMLVSQAEPRTWFYDKTGEIGVVENFVPPPRGTGVLVGGSRYRIDDVWQSFENEGRFVVGYHVSLRLVDGSDDDPAWLLHASVDTAVQDPAKEVGRS